MREEEINEKLKEEKISRAERARQLISSKYLEQEKTYVDDFLKIMQELLCEFLSSQKNNEGRKLKYIQVKCLRTSVVDESYRYNICLRDEKGYKDTCIIERYYTPLYIKPLIEEDKFYFEKEIMKRIIRAKKYDVKDFLRPYIWDTYMKPIPSEIEENIINIGKIDVYQKILKSEEVIVSYGELLEKYDKHWIFTN
ncbi:MAG: hypothetical protein IJD58_12915 [Lachnospiraceae bacterium]|nr:hypothetical protein [Lachnospiraceae bacterium]